MSLKKSSKSEQRTTWKRRQRGVQMIRHEYDAILERAIKKAVVGHLHNRYRVMKTMTCFINSGRPAMELVDLYREYATHKSMRASFAKTISTTSYQRECAVLTRRGRVYLVRKLPQQYISS